MKTQETSGYKIYALEYRIRWFFAEISMPRNKEFAAKLSAKMQALQSEVDHLRYNVSWQYV
jgi:hypothetical protein